MPLTDTAVKNAKPRETTDKLSDGGGLQLWVKPNGTKLWCLAFRDDAGKQQKLSFGPYPEISLADARSMRAEAKVLLAKGIDPREHAKQEKANKLQAEANAKANTFGARCWGGLQHRVRAQQSANGPRTTSQTGLHSA